MTLDYKHIEKLLQIIDEDKKLNVPQFILYQDIDKVIKAVFQVGWEVGYRDGYDKYSNELKDELCDYIMNF